MPQIVLILPGATDYDAQHRIQGNLDVPINEQGAAEIARMIEELRSRPFDSLYSACGESAVQTGTVLAAAFGLKLRVLDKLENLNQGLWQGMLVEEVRLKQPKVYRQWQEHPENVCPPEGEMLGDAVERVETILQKLIKKHKSGVLGLVAAEPLASLVRRFVTHGPLGDLWKAAAEHGRWEILDLQPQVLVSSS
jgi:broad specificity phosphatase PhoE